VDGFLIRSGSPSAGIVGTLWSHNCHAEFFAILTGVSAVTAALLLHPIL
jgi:hypothetical protein